MCVEMHHDTALNDGCDESGFEVDYPFTGLGYALKYTQRILFNFETGILLHFVCRLSNKLRMQHATCYSKTCLKRTPYIPETWTNGK